MIYNVTFIPGDGVGPEIAEATRRVLEATGVDFSWDVVNAGADVVAEYGTPLPEHVLDSIRKNRVAIKGPITTPVGSGFRSVNVAMRKELDLYACVRPIKSYQGAPVAFDDIDFVIYRENMEDLYAGIEFEQGTEETAGIIDEINRIKKVKIRPDSGVSIKPISVTGTERIVTAAFEYARRNGRFLATARRIAEDYKDIEFEDRIVDNMTMQMVRKPQQFDVIVTLNLYGDILSDLGAGLIGGLGLAPGANIGDETALFEPTHGSAPKYKGMNKVNPMAMMLSGVMMLRHIGEAEAAQRLEDAIAGVIAEGKSVTYDLKPESERSSAVGTSQVADAVIARMG